MSDPARRLKLELYLDADKFRSVVGWRVDGVWRVRLGGHGATYGEGSGPTLDAAIEDAQDNGERDAIRLQPKPLSCEGTDS